MMKLIKSPQLGLRTNIQGFIYAFVSLIAAKPGRIVDQHALMIARK